jgi:hypothetical protein
MSKEIWKPIPGYIGMYEASNKGNIRAIKRILATDRGQRVYCKRLLKPSTTKVGYKRIVLSKSGKTKTFMVHRLVLLSFIKNEFNKKSVNHKDGDKANNQIENLEWATLSENQIHRYYVLGKYNPKKIALA